jgi:ABC-2 type transport system ATP-binding protein
MGGALRIGGIGQSGDGGRTAGARGHELVRDLVEAFPEEVASVSLGKPTLEDVFIERTGHRFWDEEGE